MSKNPLADHNASIGKVVDGETVPWRELDPGVWTSQQRRQWE